MKKIIGWIFCVAGILVPVVAIIMTIVDPNDNIAISLGLIGKSLIATVIAVPWGAYLIKQARKEDMARIVQEIRRLATEKEAEWLQETNGSISMPDWLKQKGYLDKYKAVIDLGSNEIEIG